SSYRPISVTLRRSHFTRSWVRARTSCTSTFPYVASGFSRTSREVRLKPDTKTVLGPDLGDHRAVDVRQPHVAPVESIRQLRVIEPDRIQQRGVQIVIRDRLFQRFVAEIVGRADHLPAFDAGAGHQHGLCARIVIAADAAL